MEPEVKGTDKAVEAVQPSNPQQKEEMASPMTVVVCGLVILAFVGWVAWLALGGDDKSKEPKKLTDEQYRQTVFNASQADPELKEMLLMKKRPHKASALPSSKADINSASAEQLKNVPGLDEWDVNAIVKLRPYKSLDELVTKKALGAARFSDVQGFLSVSAN